MKAGAENETNAKGNKAPKVKAPKSINANKPKQPKVTKPKASKIKKGVKPTAPEPVVVIKLSLPALDLTLDTADGSGENNEAALQTIAEEYALAAIESALSSVQVKSITVTITEDTSRRRRTMRRLEAFKYIITVTVEY